MPTLGLPGRVQESLHVLCGDFAVLDPEAHVFSFQHWQDRFEIAWNVFQGRRRATDLRDGAQEAGACPFGCRDLAQQVVGLQAACAGLDL